MATRVDLLELVIAIVGALVVGAVVALIGYLLGAPAGLLGTLTGAVVSSSVALIYTKRQKRRVVTGKGEM